MKNNASIFSAEYKITSLNINANKKLGLFGLLGFLQDSAGDHALKLGFGYEDSLRNGFFWVLVRQKLRMNRWPDWHDIITIKTWSKPLSGIYAFREYEIYVDNELIGDCSTTWMILDTETRRPKKIEHSEELFLPRKDDTLNYSADKLNLPENLVCLKTFDVRNSDLDMSMHVNNIKYSQWILDSIPFDYHNRFKVKEYEINFSGEVFLDDKIEIHSNVKNLLPSDNYNVYFRGERNADGKTVFYARIFSEERE